ncbi:MAG: ribonuclease P protein component [Clostridia bacterium]|nr:ribonuclease P protein component [Clostridia bacterium]
MTFDYRLKKEKEFKLVFEKGKRLFSKSLTIIYFPAKELKAGFAVSKKHGGSVIRNRIKRLLRESFRSFTPTLRKNFFFVIIPKVKNESSFLTFYSELKQIFESNNFLEKEC